MLEKIKDWLADGAQLEILYHDGQDVFFAEVWKGDNLLAESPACDTPEGAIYALVARKEREGGT